MFPEKIRENFHQFSKRQTRRGTRITLIDTGHIEGIGIPPNFKLNSSGGDGFQRNDRPNTMTLVNPKHGDPFITGPTSPTVPLPLLLNSEDVIFWTRKIKFQAEQLIVKWPVNLSIKRGSGFSVRI